MLETQDHPGGGHAPPCSRGAPADANPLQAPFVWFGGKRRAAAQVWQALGDVDNYVEPFAGSLAVLLGRPGHHRRRCETVNDADAFLANFWRAIAADPDAVARYADWPVNETDLFARHLWLVRTGRERIAQLEADPEWYDAKVAGWWVWGVNAWIGSGWCAGTGPWVLADDEQGHQLPHLGSPGQGVNRQLPHLGSPGRDLRAYFAELAARLRRVRVCCGDWSRVVTNGALSYGATVGVFLDPPYAGDVRTGSLYAVDNAEISAAVRGWAIEHGGDRRLRIVLAGYATEHAPHMPPEWRVVPYTAGRAYGTAATAGTRTGNNANRHLERLWFSPHCLGSHQDSLFELGESA